LDFSRAWVLDNTAKLEAQVLEITRGSGMVPEFFNDRLEVGQGTDSRQWRHVAYGLHARQFTGGPAWLELDKYDVTGKPDQPGVPNVTQLRTMVQKLLVDRRQLTFHHEKKELSDYAITVAKAD
jgi:uncharacterized protein (TIGR03435 family)